MGMILLIIVLLAALLTIASGVWVAIALMSALRYRNGKETSVESAPSHQPA